MRCNPQTAFAALAVAAVTAGSAAHAGSFSLREQSTTGQGLAFAGVAAGSGGLSSIYWNPAWRSGRQGLEIEGNLSAVLPYNNVTPEAGTSPILLGATGTGDSGDIAIDGMVPSTYASYQLNDRVWLGLSMNAPYGLKTKYDNPFAGQIYATTSRVFSLEVSPSATIAVNDWLAVGFGLRTLYFSTDLSRALSPAPYAPLATLDGTMWAMAEPPA